MKPEFITSWQNASLKKLRQAVNDKHLCMIEGPKLLREFVAAQLGVEFVLFNEADYPRHAALLHNQHLQNARILIVPEKIYKKLAETISSQGVLACGKVPELKELDSENNKSLNRLLVCDAIQDPGNLGTLVRTALAFSVDGIVLLPNCANPFASKVLRASAGAAFHLPIFKAEPEQFFDYARDTSMPVYALDGNAGKKVTEISGSRLSLVIGNEGHGLSQAVYLGVTELLAIPLDSRSESLNAAIAGAIAMYELFSAEKGAGNE